MFSNLGRLIFCLHPLDILRSKKKKKKILLLSYSISDNNTSAVFNNLKPQIETINCDLNKETPCVAIKVISL